MKNILKVINKNLIDLNNQIGAVAGVMGGNDTKIDDNTVNIVIEAATFDGATLRGTARRLNLLTDASQHYIKGALNTANSLNVLDRCADLLVQLADAKEIYETVSTELKVEPKVVEVVGSPEILGAMEHLAIPAKVLEKDKKVVLEFQN